MNATPPLGASGIREENLSATLQMSPRVHIRARAEPVWSACCIKRQLWAEPTGAPKARAAPQRLVERPQCPKCSFPLRAQGPHPPPQPCLVPLSEGAWGPFRSTARQLCWGCNLACGYPERGRHPPSGEVHQGRGWVGGWCALPRPPQEAEDSQSLRFSTRNGGEAGGQARGPHRGVRVKPNL